MLELTRGEEVPWCRGGGEGESLLDWLSWLVEARLPNLSSHLLNTSLVTSKKTSLLVRSIKRVDEWVDTGTVSAGRNTVDKVSCISIVVSWRKVGSVPVKLQVSMSGVMRVDEWVEVRINWCINIVIVNRLSNRSSLLDRGRCGCLGNKGSSFLPSSSCRNMSSL